VVIMLKKMLYGGIVALLFRALTSSADIDGREVFLTGNNPPGWDNQALTNIVQNSSNVEETQPTNNLDNAFFIYNDFNGLPVDTNTFVNTFDSSVKRVSESDDCTQDFETGVSGANNSVPLAYGTGLVSTVVSGDFIYALDPNLNLGAGEEDFHYFNPTNLGVIVGVVDRTWIDTDGDGLSDDSEDYLHKTEKNNPDSDYDGQNDGDEVVTGSDPLDANDSFGIDSITRYGDITTIGWDGKSNINYNVWRGTNLLESFTNVNSRTPLEDGVQTYSETNNLKKVFYKIDASY